MLKIVLTFHDLKVIANNKGFSNNCFKKIMVFITLVLTTIVPAMSFQIKLQVLKTIVVTKQNNLTNATKTNVTRTNVRRTKVRRTEVRRTKVRRKRLENKLY